MKPEELRSLTLNRRAFFREQLQDEFLAKVERLAERVAYRGHLRVWHREMIKVVRDHLLQQSLLAAQGEVRGDDLRRLKSVLRRELKYLANFADEIAAARALRKPMSAAAIAARAKQYAGAGRAQWFRALEERPAKNVVYDYVSRDDKGTCQPCLKAEADGPYLASDGPFPSEVCRGRGFCRCRRVARVSAKDYRRLIRS
jgi:hypothetical protein